MCYPVIRLRARRDESLLRHHPWIFSGAIASVPSGLESGSIVRICGSDGTFLGIGHYQASTIAVRILSWEDRAIDTDFWYQYLTNALSMRKRFGFVACTDTNAFRLVHGEGDGLPGLVIDCYGNTAVVQAHSLGMHKARYDVAAALKAVCGDWIHHIYYKSETTLSKTDDHSFLNGYIGIDGQSLECLSDNEECNAHEALENGLRFLVDWEHGQKTGFFLDQRDNRRLLERYASGCRVLNLFCYTGGFSCYALRGGAAYVDSVDSSERAIALLKANVSLNFGDEPRHSAICIDAFKFLDTITQPYDIIVLDPPAFAKHRHSLHNALQGYTRLNRMGLEHVASGGLVFTFSCSQAVSKEHFRGAVMNAAMQSGRNVRILHQLHQPVDHPIGVSHAEGEYLKGLVLYVE